MALLKMKLSIYTITYLLVVYNTYRNMVNFHYLFMFSHHEMIICNNDFVLFISFDSITKVPLTDMPELDMLSHLTKL